MQLVRLVIIPAILILFALQFANRTAVAAGGGIPCASEHVVVGVDGTASVDGPQLETEIVAAGAAVDAFLRCPAAPTLWLSVFGSTASDPEELVPGNLTSRVLQLREELLRTPQWSDPVRVMPVLRTAIPGAAILLVTDGLVEPGPADGPPSDLDAYAGAFIELSKTQPVFLWAVRPAAGGALAGRFGELWALLAADGVGRVTTGRPSIAQAPVSGWQRVEDAPDWRRPLDTPRSTTPDPDTEFHHVESARRSVTAPPTAIDRPAARSRHVRPQESPSTDVRTPAVAFLAAVLALAAGALMLGRNARRPAHRPRPSLRTVQIGEGDAWDLLDVPTGGAHTESGVLRVEPGSGEISVSTDEDQVVLPRDGSAVVSGSAWMRELVGTVLPAEIPPLEPPRVPPGVPDTKAGLFWESP